MKIQIESTSMVVQTDNVPARVWEGVTDSGIKVICFVTRIAVDKSESEEVHGQFRKELLETKAPSAKAQSFPLRMIL